MRVALFSVEIGHEWSIAVLPGTARQGRCYQRRVAALRRGVAGGFLPGLLTWLQRESALPLEIAQVGGTLMPGTVYFAPDERHLVVTGVDQIGLSQPPPVSHVRPSATVLLRSVAKVYGADAIGVLLTGMGDDGAAGLLALHEQGGLTIAQDEASSVVFGMPKVAVDLGAVDHVLSLNKIAPTLVSLIQQRS